MVTSSDLARGRQAIEEDRTRQIVRQHETQQRSFFKFEVLPRMGIVGFLAGWSLMSALNNILKNDSSKQ